MKIHDMRRSTTEKKAVVKQMMAPLSMEGRDFAHGLHLSLDAPELNRLGIPRDAQAGDSYRIEGEMRVIDARSRDSEDGGASRQVEFVLHRLGAELKERAERGRDPSIRESLEDARHQARGSTAPPGPGAPLGARFNRQ